MSRSLALLGLAALLLGGCASSAATTGPSERPSSRAGCRSESRQGPADSRPLIYLFCIESP
ncbi:MAG TPA: hypothetical protein VFN71_03315 [Methylomirabilota bacterium]|nr:hypothetical protein [Methylomirabilota bacterium]